MVRRRTFEGVKISLFAAGHETFRDGFQFLPARADLCRLGPGDFVVRRRPGDDGKQVGEFPHDLVGGRVEQMRLRRVLGVHDEKSAGPLADPLNEALVAGAADERLNAVERIADAGIRLRPLVAITTSAGPAPKPIRRCR